MYVPLGIKSDYSILQSLVKIKDLVNFLKKHDITACALIDNRLFGVMDFYNTCLNNGIKPIIGLDVEINNQHIYLYAKDYDGYKTLLKINTLVQERELAVVDLLNNKYQVICVVPFIYNKLYNDMVQIFEEVYISYSSEYEKNNALILTKNVVFVNEVRALTEEDTKYLRYLDLINESSINKSEEVVTYEKNYFVLDYSDDDEFTTNEFAAKLNVEIPHSKRYIPHYPVENSTEYLYALAKKGLLKRLNGNLNVKYVDRLKYELDVITKMGFVDYFLIVYDYVKYAKKHNILVGPGRGSAAGSLVSYVLGITSIDPLKYNLLFERFLNPERVTMPDIDIDFEFTKRDEVINYVKEKYGHDKVAAIMTYGTLAAKQVIRDVGRILNVDLKIIDELAKVMDSKKSLVENTRISNVKMVVNKYSELKDVYRIAMKLEGLKRHVSTHAAGVVISSEALDNLIPIYKSGEVTLTGVTMEYLENLGLLKMDFLALKNLTIIKNVIDLIKDYTNENLALGEIPLDDEGTLKLFREVDTEGIFQFESNGMKAFLKKLKISSFSDIVAAIALYRPGPMENIDIFIARKEGREKITYFHEDLKPILSDTYGIMIYQEQIMQVLVKMGGYTFAEADNIRRAMSKKKKEVMEKEQGIFIERAIKKGYTKDLANEVYAAILKFANYGFNKAHSVAYALIGYQMAYLKRNYPIFFIANLLNMSIGSELKTREYIVEAKKNGIKIQRPDVNLSFKEYGINDNNLMMPLSVIKGIGNSIADEIINERLSNGKYKDFYDFIVRVNKLGIGKKTIELLIKAGAMDCFMINHKTMINNLDDAINYGELCKDLDESLVLKPVLVSYDEYEDGEIIQDELNCYGFYISNHPASKYSAQEVVKVQDVIKYFDKYVKMVVLITSIKKIKTKKNEDMALGSATDETGLIKFVIFPKNNSLISLLKQDKLYMMYGQITRRNYDYQIVVSNTLEL